MLRWLPVIVAMVVLRPTGAAAPAPGNAGTNTPYPEAPAFTTLPRKDSLRFYPCTRCHEEDDADPEPRRLRTRHTRELDHGGDRIWCLVCHDSENMDYLHTLNDEKIALDQAYVVCGSCHADGFRILSDAAGASAPMLMDPMSDGRHCGRCHDGETAFDVEDDCELCHEE